MKFGKEFTTHLETSLPEWRDKYLRYKLLKKLLKTIPPPTGDDPPPLRELQDWFVGILNEELEKFNDFYVDKEEDFIIRFQALKERIDRVKEKSIKGGVFTSEVEFSEEMMEIRKDFVSIHGEMVLLKNYSSLNFAGLIKILKKYDKRTGELLSLPFTQLAFQQPFFKTDPLSRLVHECEENLEILFPLEAEVVESVNTSHDTSTTQADMSNTDLEMTLGEDTVDIFRSTLAAITAIQGLKKESSTYNPLSLSYLFGKQNNDGALTAENSPRESLMDCSDDDDTEIRHMMIDIQNYSHFEVFENVNKHCTRRRNKWMAMLRRNYFHNPWAILSVFAAVVLLLLTTIQTVYSILSYTK